MIGLLNSAFWQTIVMVLVATAFAVLGGLPLGVILFVTEKNRLWSKPTLHRILGAIVNAMRSIPFIILMVAIIPFTRLIVGTSIGTVAAIVPLSLCAIPFFARLTQTAIQEIPSSLIEASQSMGASTWQIIWHVLIPESLPSLVRAITLTAVTLVGYSAMAGAIGGGGLGDLAIRYGYQRFEVNVMIVTVVILILLVQLMQYAGDYIANKISHYK
jgi:ABC-type methionine transport system permease subunit